MTELREARRKDRALSKQEALEVLTASDYGVLATVSGDGMPYAVPMNFVVSGDVLYTHSTPHGHKMTNLTQNPRVSFCAVQSAMAEPSILSTYYASAIVFGEAEPVADDGEKFQALQMLMKRYSGEMTAENEAYVARMMPHATILRIRIHEISGKAHRKEE